MNLFSLLDAAASMLPDREAVADGRPGLTYAELALEARKWARWIEDRCHGQPVIYAATCRTEFAVALFACGLAGSPLVPINYRAKATEVDRFLEVAQPGLILAEDRYRPLFSRWEGEVVSLDDPPGVVMPVGGMESEPVDEGPAVCLFTSGTSGDPKLVVLTHQNLSEYVLNTVEAASSAPSEAALLSTPPYHVAAVAGIVSNVFRGRRLRLVAQFDATSWLEVVQREQITYAMVVPTMLARILDVIEARPDLRPDSLTILSYGGSLPPPGLVERALRLLPSTVGLVNAFGLTETSSTVALLSPDDHRDALSSHDPEVRRRLDSVGRPVPGIEVAIHRPDGSRADTGEEGEVWLRGAQVSPGYFGVSSTGAREWLATGDRGHFDQGGYLFVSGRLDDIIIRGGENIDPAEIEAALLANPHVQEAAVAGLPDSEWGQMVVAEVTGDGQATEGELMDWVRSRLAGYKVPVAVRWVSALPRNDLGKLVRRQVADRVAADFHPHSGGSRRNDE